MWPHNKQHKYHAKPPPPQATVAQARLLLLLLVALCAHLLASGSAQAGVATGQSARPADHHHNQQLNHLRSNQQQVSTTAGSARAQDEQLAAIHLESMADLDHLAYLALRNYNLTDERLLQSSWLVGSSALALRRAAAAAAAADEEATASLDTLAFGGATPDDGGGGRGRLALMLESLLLHLRTGHRRRMNLEELDQVVVNSNLTEPLEALRRQRAARSELATNARVSAAQWLNGTASELPGGQGPGEASSMSPREGDSELRCSSLVTLYKYELLERFKGQSSAGVVSPPPMQSKVEYESAALPPTVATTMSANGSALDTNQPQQMPLVWLDDKSEEASSPEQQLQVDEMRLMGLCKLAVQCRSAEELVELISRPWKGTGTETVRRIEPRAAKFVRRRRADSTTSDPDHLERDASEPEDSAQHQRRKSLRDSLSMSLAKLCPLVLFPLHEDETQCMVRRDDRPPLVTVWVFATLFVTIVCFCSLIGLSITPLLGHSPSAAATAVDSSAGSEASGPPAAARRQRLGGSQSPALQRQQHKASLTLFEGLAVGSLVGSALFSLIPQAFELQERESNRGFLLKAFIIFSGIYLFFLSERIMRIILDTRQKRKKKKRLNHRHRSSTTAAVEMMHNPHHHQFSTIDQHHHKAQYLGAPPGTTSGTGGSRLPRPSTSSRGSGSRSRSGVLLQGVSKNPPITGDKVDAKQQHKLTPVAQPTITQQQEQLAAERMHRKRRLAVRDAGDTSQLVAPTQEQQQQQAAASAVLRRPRRRHRRAARQHRKRANASRHLQSQHHHQARKVPLPALQSAVAATQQHPRRKRANANAAQERAAKRAARRARSDARESDLDATYQRDLAGETSATSGSSSSSSSPSTSSSSSFSSYALKVRPRGLAHDGLIMVGRADARQQQTGDSQADCYSSESSSGSSDARQCSSCSSFDRDFCGATPLNPSDSDDDNDQRRAVTKQISEISRRHAQSQLKVATPQPPVARTTFKFDHDDHREAHPDQWGPMPYCVSRASQADRGGHQQQQQHVKQDISTVAWMIVLGDGLHNFIDGISIGAAFSESILSGVSISVAVICEEFPHELGDFAVLVSSGMTVRQALGYNFLSACTCYLGMAVGIILGDVNDGASYISALAAGVFLYIALVDMMGELSAALESSSRDSIARTLKLLLLQNVGIAIGISIIFVLSFIDF